MSLITLGNLRRISEIVAAGSGVVSGRFSRISAGLASATSAARAVQSPSFWVNRVSRSNCQARLLCALPGPKPVLG